MEKVTIVTPDDKLGMNCFFLNREAFARHDLELALLVTGSGEPVVQALLDGRGSYTHVCGSPVPAAVAGRGLKILGAFQVSSFALYAHPEIKSLKQLAGKRIALFGSITRPNLNTALRRHGVPIEAVEALSPRDLERLVGSRPDYLAWHQTVLDGLVSAISVNAPRSEAARQAGLQCLIRFGDVFPIPTFAILAPDRVVQGQRDQAERFLRGLLDAIDDFIRDPSLGKSLLRQLDIPEHLLDGTYWEICGDLRPDARLSEDVQRVWVGWCKDVLGLDEEVPLSRAFDFSLLERALLQR